jgi:3,4-dihydroxy 2-butanone 4-phosphate synthase/GTP cyclohydrolase II
MTNNPDKVQALEDYGLKVSERVPVEAAPRAANARYLATKRTKFGHLLSLVGGSEDGKKDP